MSETKQSFAAKFIREKESWRRFLVRSPGKFVQNAATTRIDGKLFSRFTNFPILNVVRKISATIRATTNLLITKIRKILPKCIFANCEKYQKVDLRNDAEGFLPKKNIIEPFIAQNEPQEYPGLIDLILLILFAPLLALASGLSSFLSEISEENCIQKNATSFTR